MPARALYHAIKAANNPKKPPALMTGSRTVSLEYGWRYPIPSNKKAKSRKKNSRKKAMVDRKVTSRRRVVKMNQPFDYTYKSSVRISLGGGVLEPSDY